MPSVQQDRGGGRYAVPSRHGQKGGGRRGGEGCWGLLERYDHGGRVGLRDTESLRQGRQGASRGIAEGAQRRQQRGQEHVDPLIRFALDHPEQAPVHHLERIGFQRGEQEEQPIFRRRQGAIFVHGKLADRPGFPIKAPRGHMGLERRLEGRKELLEFVEGSGW